MKAFLLSSLLVAAILTGCDFPSDPPLKPDTPVVPPVSTIDTAKALLPLRPGAGWVYYAVPRFGPPVSYITTITPEDLNGGTWYRVVYTHTLMGPTRVVMGFPVLLRNLPQGLGFYSYFSPGDTTATSRPPRAQFVLPYPAKVDSVWNDTNFNNEYTVRVVAKDTTVADYSGLTHKVYRYEIVEKGKDRTTMYVIPGKAIMRIEQQDVTFQTVAWFGF